MATLLLEGKSKLSNTPDTDGTTVGDMLINVCAIACMVPMIVSGSHIVALFSAEPPRFDWLPFSQWLFFDHGFTAFFASIAFLWCILELGWKHRDSRSIKMRLKLTSHSGDLGENVAKVLERIRCGRFNIQLSCEAHSKGTLSVMVPTKRPRTSTEIMEALRNSDVEVKVA